MRRINNILVVGVGGQGIILATDVIAATFLRAGFDSKKSEVHGMAQRGGSVESHVRRGDSVASPLISPGDVDAMVAMEGLEALRYAHMMHPDGQILYDPLRLPPLAVATGSAEYPEDVTGRLARYAAKIHVLPAYEMAEDDQPINAGVLNRLQGEILDDYWAGEVDIDDGARLTWMRQHHYYDGLYSYSYSAGLTIGTSVARNIREGGEPAAERWLEVLKAGGTKSPLQLAAMAGIDMTESEPIRDMVDYVGSLVDELEELY